MSIFSHNLTLHNEIQEIVNLSAFKSILEKHKDTKQAILIANGLCPPKKLVDQIVINGDLIIAVDGGAHNAKKLELEPDFIIGDGDSFNITKIPHNYFILHDQDSCDLEKALEICSYFNIKEVKILGAGGFRLDHILTNLVVINKYKRIFSIRIEDEFSSTFIKDKSFEIDGWINRKISLYPIGNNVKNITTKGLAYELNKCDLNIYGIISTLNYMNTNKATINFSEGDLLVIIEQEYGL